MSISLNTFLDGNPKILGFTSTDSLLTILGLNYLTDFISVVTNNDILFVSYEDGVAVCCASIVDTDITLVLQSLWSSTGKIPIQSANPVTRDTSTTLTAVDITGKIITSAPEILTTTTLTLPTATNLLASFASAPIGSMFDCMVINLGAGTVAIATNTGMTLNLSNSNIPTNNASLLRFVITATETPAISVYG